VQRILVGGFGPIARLGLREILDQAAIEIVAECEPGLVMTFLAAVPSDVVVLDLDASDTDQLARTVAARHPAVTVVACSVDRSLMRVYPRTGSGHAYSRELTAAALAEAARN
jgi:AmiR/NasT family two-component response regulator